MAWLFVSSAGSNTAPYDTWAKAATSLQTALTAASSGSDIVYVQWDAVPAADNATTADKTYTVASHVSVLSVTKGDVNTAWTYRPMDYDAWLGSNAGWSVIFSGAADRNVRLYGLTFRLGGTTASKTVRLGSTSGVNVYGEDCTFWMGGTGTGQNVVLGTTTADAIELVNAKFRFAASTSQIICDSKITIRGALLDTLGVNPSTLFATAQTTRTPTVEVSGLTAINFTGTIVGNCANAVLFRFTRCAFGSGAVTLASQTSNPTAASASAEVIDCSYGTTLQLYGFFNAMGSVVTDTAVYKTAGLAQASWKITTTSNASINAPFYTPWIYTELASGVAVTPYLDVSVSGASPIQRRLLWADFGYESSSSASLEAFASGRPPLSQYLSVALPWDDTADSAAWTNPQGAVTHALKPEVSGVATPITPQSTGDLRIRVAVATPTFTCYVDPQVRF